VTKWQGDARFLRVVDEHSSALFHLALLLTGNRADAEDVVQDSLMAVADRWSTVRKPSSFAYLKRVVANRSMDVLRARRTIPVAELPDRAVTGDSFLRFEEDQRFFALVNTLPEGQKNTLVLRFFADLDDRAIGRILGCSAQTVRSQASRGLEKLRRSVEVNR